MQEGEGGAHLTGTIRLQTPSIFEVISEENFRKAIASASFHIVKFLARSYPEKLGVLFRRFDEVYLFFDTLLQNHYLKTRGGTISEAFYGLERVSIRDNGLNHRYLSLASAVLLPYFKEKLKKLYDRICEKTTLTFKEEAFKKFYIIFFGALDFIRVVYYIFYAFGKTRQHSLLFWLLSLRLDYLSNERALEIESNSRQIFNFDYWRDIRQFPMKFFFGFGECALFAIEMSSFFMQFLSWWGASGERSHLVFDNLPIPPPPPTSHLEKNKCILCSCPFKNPTALQTSGTVYCYSCIFNYIRSEGKCPLTQIPSNVNHLVRIFI